MRIWFDMDGTLADLYNVPNWLEKLDKGDFSPYKEARANVHLATVARLIHKAQRKGCEVGILSWSSKNATLTDEVLIAQIKREWLRKHLPSVCWDYIAILPYGTPKHDYACGGILFDDNTSIRKKWGKLAFTPAEINEVLSKI